MIKKVTVDYNLDHAPGTLMMVCKANGYIVYDHYKKKKSPCRSGTPARASAKKMYASIIEAKRRDVNGNAENDMAGG